MTDCRISLASLVLSEMSKQDSPGLATAIASKDAAEAIARKRMIELDETSVLQQKQETVLSER